MTWPPPCFERVRMVWEDQMGVTTAREQHGMTRAEFGPVTVCFGDRNGKYPDGNQVIVRGTDSVAVFDTPISANAIGPDFTNADLCILGHVHEDHMAGLHLLKGKPVYAHEADVAAARSWDALADVFGYEGAEERAASRARFEQDFHYVETPDAIAYKDGATWDLGGVTVRAVHMPGHTPGHCALLVEPYGLAFIGDIDLSTFGPYYGDANSSMHDFRETLRKVRDLPAKVWVTFHHKGVYTDRQRFLDDLSTYEARFDERDVRLMEMLRAAPKTLEQLARGRLLYPAHFNEPWVDGVEARSIAMHLDELMGKGRVARDADGRYRLA